MERQRLCVCVCACLSVRERQGVVSEFAPLWVYVWMLIVRYMLVEMPCVELGVCQERYMRASMGECVVCVAN